MKEIEGATYKGFLKSGVVFKKYPYLKWVGFLPIGVDSLGYRAGASGGANGSMPKTSIGRILGVLSECMRGVCMCILIGALRGLHVIAETRNRPRQEHENVFLGGACDVGGLAGVDSRHSGEEKGRIKCFRDAEGGRLEC